VPGWVYAIVLLLSAIVAVKWGKAAHETERAKLIAAIDLHCAALKRNLERAVRRNDYGAVIQDRTRDALEEFFASVGLNQSVIPWSEAVSIVFDQLEHHNARSREAGFDAANLPFDGHSFERWVAEALTGFGWEAEVTRGSGDQGLDVLAKRGGNASGCSASSITAPSATKRFRKLMRGRRTMASIWSALCRTRPSRQAREIWRRRLGSGCSHIMTSQIFTRSCFR
jgi:restriction system protein